MAILNDEQKEKIIILFDIAKDYVILGWLKTKKFFKALFDHFYNNFFSYLGIAILLTIIIVIRRFIVTHFVADTINAYEIRFYIISFLFLFTLMNFAVLRMYNATVANTSFIIKLRAEIRKLTGALNTAKQEAGKTRGILRTIQGSIQKVFNMQQNSKGEKSE